MLQISTDFSGYGQGSESYTRESFQEVAERMNLSSEELDIMFTALDSDGDGIITHSDLICESPRLKSTPVHRKPDTCEKYKHPFKDPASDFRVLSTEWLVRLLCLKEFYFLNSTKQPSRHWSFCIRKKTDPSFERYDVQFRTNFIAKW